MKRLLSLWEGIEKLVGQRAKPVPSSGTAQSVGPESTLARSLSKVAIHMTALNSLE